MLYQAYQAHRDLTAPARALAGLARWTVGELPDAWTDNPLSRRLSAGYEMVGRSRLTHERPPFGIDQVTVAGRPVAVREEVALATPFSTLLHFAKDDVTGPQPTVLLVTALAGHFSTLLRSTIRSLLADHDVYVTDWHNARDVGVEHGAFGFDDYVGQLITFLEHIGPGAHLMAVCQPCPAALSCGIADGRGRQPGPAEEPDADGRPGRHPGQPDQGQRAGPRQADQLVRAAT